MSNLEFTNRETYIAWRAQWRANYKQISLEIREGKANLATQFRESDLASARTQRNLLSNRSLANQMMLIRTAATEKKNEIIAAKMAEAQIKQAA